MSPPDPRANPHLLGHEAAEQEMAEALQGSRMHHAWLITGPEGIGKATLAYRFARRLLAGRPETATLAIDPAAKIFRRVAQATHADLHTLEREWDPKRKRMRGEIIVDDVRKAIAFLTLTPAEGGWRVVIVDGAEHLNRNAANALLKLLEEPPRQAVLLLVCSAPGRLLPTLRSRCRRLKLDPLDDAAMARTLAHYLPDQPQAERDRLITLAEGAPGRALTLAAEEGIALAALVEDVLEKLPEVSATRAHQLADTLARAEGGFSTFMDLLRAALSRAVRAEARAGQGRLSRLRPLEEWCDIWQTLTRLQHETENFNLDKRQALLSGLLSLNGP